MIKKKKKTFQQTKIEGKIYIIMKKHLKKYTAKIIFNCLKE